MAMANQYTTDNLPLAAWLLTKAHRVVRVNRESTMVSWTFVESDRLHDHVFEFNEGEPIGNVRAFDQARGLLYKSIRTPEALTIQQNIQGG